MNCTALLLSFLLFLSACTSSVSSQNAPDQSKPKYEGNVYEQAKEIYSDEESLYPCDRLYKNKAIELSQIVENNRTKINELIEKTKTSRLNEGDKFNYYKMGEVQFFDQKSTTESNDVWEESFESWRRADFLYQQISSNLDDPHWVRLNAMVRSLILMDTARIYNADHPGLRRSEKDRVLRVTSFVEECFKHETCISLALESRDLAWLSEGLKHLDLYYLLRDDEINRSEKRSAIKWLNDDLSISARIYGFTKNPLISVKENKLIVPLKLQAFGPDAENAIQLIEKNWNTQGLSVKIDPVSESQDGYSIVIKNTPGQRAYVSHTKKEMGLFPPVRSSTFIHEFGHVLGLMDSYYTSYNQTKCMYVYESNPGDLMSESGTGKILPAHIEQIKKAYGL